MKETVNNLEITADFSDDGKHRYLLRYVWDKKKPLVSVIMITPGASPKLDSEELITGTSENLSLCNSFRLGKYGGVNILNLFSRIRDDYAQTAKNSYVGATTEENDKMIMETIKDTDIIIAPGTIINTSKIPFLRACQLFKELEEKYPDRLYYIGDGFRKGNHHPLDIYMRRFWVLEKTNNPYEQLLKSSKFGKDEKKEPEQQKNIPTKKKK